MNGAAMRGGAFAALMLLAAAGAWPAETLPPATPDDFAFGATIHTDADQPLYELPLPAVVYQRSARADLGDLRVFNAAGEAVPHGLLPGPLRSPQTPRRITLPVFPFEEAARRAGGLDVRIAQNADGTRVTVRGSAETPAIEHAWLVDADALTETPVALLLAWPAASAPFTRRVTVEGSQDLDHWQRLAEAVTIADVSWAGERLLANRVDLSRGRYRWYRVRPADGTETLPGLGVSAELPVDGDRGSAREWMPVPVEPGADARAELGFETPVALPVDRIRLDPAERNTFLRLRLQARGIKDKDWRETGAGSVYRLDYGGTMLRSAPLPVHAVGATRWRLLADTANGTGFGPAAPAVEVGWIPRSLVFLARGEGPFTLAFGSKRVTPVTADGRRRLGAAVVIVGLPRATHGDPRELSPTTHALRERRDVDWKQLVLWGVLVGGAALLALLALRLMRKPREANDSR